MEWTRAQDTKLMTLIAEGKSASQIAPVLGTTRNSVIGRSNRIRGTVFQSDVERLTRQRRASVERKRAIAARRTLAIGAFKRCLDKGMRRDKAITSAIAAGATLRQIGGILGISYQRVGQIASGAG